MQQAQLLAATTALTHAIDALVGLRDALSALTDTPSAHETNVKPAPFALNELTVRSLIEGSDDQTMQAGVIAVPIVSIPLVDRPRRSEDPRLARANDDQLQPPPGVTRRSGEDGASGAVSGAQPVTEAAPHSFAGSTAAQPLPPAEPRGARKRDVMVRQAKDRDARALEKPVDQVDIVRERPGKLALPSETTDFRPQFGSTTPKSKIVIPPLSPFARRQRLQDAVAFLKRKCILVSVVDRSAMIRRYRVSGKRDPQYAEDVIAIAIHHGFEADGGARG